MCQFLSGSVLVYRNRGKDPGIGPWDRFTYPGQNDRTRDGLKLSKKNWSLNTVDYTLTIYKARIQPLWHISRGQSAGVHYNSPAGQDNSGWPGMGLIREFRYSPGGQATVSSVLLSSFLGLFLPSGRVPWEGSVSNEGSYFSFLSFSILHCT